MLIIQRRNNTFKFEEPLIVFSPEFSSYKSLKVLSKADKGCYCVLFTVLI